MQVEQITPYGTADNKTSQVEQMFDSIAPAYDFMNRAMTLGIDRLWRRRTVKEVARRSPAQILDVATGTADLAMALAKRMPQAQVTGVDLSEGMIAIGRDKVTKAQLAERVTLQAADCLSLPFAPGSFNAVTAAFGVRNFADIPAGLREMHRVLAPGGVLAILELSTPVNPLIKPFFTLYTQGIIPRLGRMVSRDQRAYSYLLESIAAVPQREAMTSLLLKAGFDCASFHPLTFGVATLYLARK